MCSTGARRPIGAYRPGKFRLPAQPRRLGFEFAFEAKKSHVRGLIMLKFLGGTVGVIFLIGLLVVIGLLALIF